jgi:hypothetical protein
MAVPQERRMKMVEQWHEGFLKRRGFSPSYCTVSLTAAEGSACGSSRFGE